VIKLKKKIILAIIVIIIITIGVGIVLFLNFGGLTNPTYTYNIENAFPNLSFNTPVGIYDSGDGTNRLFVVEKGGKIFVVNNTQNTTEKHLFLDLSLDVSTNGERGLLGLAFHPNYTSNGYFYVYYTKSGSGDSKISRFKVDPFNENLANQSSEFPILEVSQPFSNHNGGQIAFGPDNYLYIALGDGGGAGDPSGNGQNRMTLLGSILRIDVDSSSPYAKPTDNPFYGNMDGYMEEIYAFGFRNPWRFSFDPITGALWAADVGQNSREEIDIVKIGTNYGWNAKEGSIDYNPSVNVSIVTDPLYEYNHTLGNAIVGGFVYRGVELIRLEGKYIYGDYSSGRIWALTFSGETAVNNTELIDTTLTLLSFGVDANNELYICAADGNIYKLNEL
jgi:glucose/arabinose dehydrogenase